MRAPYCPVTALLVVGSHVVAALERTWQEIQANHPEVPDVTLSLAFIKRTLGQSMGRHVVVTFACLRSGPEEVIGTLLHEAVHQQLRVAGAHDWRLHRGTFRRVAKDFGLVDEPHRLGGGELTPTARTRYSECIALLAASLKESA